MPCDKKEVLPWDKKGFDEAVALLNNAERACVLAGSGIISSGNRELFHQAFATLNSIGGARGCVIYIRWSVLTTMEYQGIWDREQEILFCRMQM